jgi:hypothetical protein
MTAETQSTPSSRRALLAAGLGGIVAVVAHALGRPLPVRATDGQAVLAGQDNSATTTTSVTTNAGSGLAGITSDGSGGVSAVSGSGVWGGVLGTASGNPYGLGWGVRGYTPGTYGKGGSFTGNGSNGIGVEATAWYGNAVYAATTPNTFPGAPVKTGVYGFADADATARGVAGETTSGRAVEGKATGGIGVWGESNTTAMVGRSNGSSTGVFGFSGSAADPLPGSSAKTGVFGFARQDASSIGVAGNSSSGTGVYGEAGTGRGLHGWSNTGIGVRAQAVAGTALQVLGRASFSRSGRLAIAAGRSSVTKTGVTPLTASSLVLAVLQTNRPGIYVRAVVPNVAGHSFTVYLNAAVPGTTNVAWFILN